MEYIREPKKKIEVIDSCDVFIAGGGFAGVSAAISAARHGAKVILAEKQCILGGLATAGLVTIYLPLCDGMGKQVSFGLAEELLKASIANNIWEDAKLTPWLTGGSEEEKIQTRYMVSFNPHMCAVKYEEMLKNLGVKILYDTTICAVKKKRNKIGHVIVENKSGRLAYKVKSVVDASGDAAISSNFAELKVKKLQKLLVKDGVVLHEKEL